MKVIYIILCDVNFDVWVRCKALYVDMGHTLGYELLEEEDYNLYWNMNRYTGCYWLSGIMKYITETFLYRSIILPICWFSNQHFPGGGDFLSSRTIYIIVYFHLEISRLLHQHLLIFRYILPLFIFIPNRSL